MLAPAWRCRNMIRSSPLWHLARAVSRLGALSVVLFLIFFGPPAPLAQTSADTLPADASMIVERALKAARLKDVNPLKRLMIPQFLWSFGGDRDADQAIEFWKADARYLDEMVRVLDRGCHIDPRVYG